MSVAPLPPLSALQARPLRVAVVGAGMMGKRHARVLASRVERFELVAVMDVDAAAAAEVARAYGVEPAGREVDAIARADALVVATPVAAHALSVRRALAAGRHVLVEKPIAGSAREAQELVALAEASGARLCVGHSERFNPVIRALARLVDPGSIQSLAFCRVGSARPFAAGATRGATGGEGALVNLGVHDFDLAAYLARSPLTPASIVRETGDRSACGSTADGESALGAARSTPAREPALGSAPSTPEQRAVVLATTESGASARILVDQRPADGRRRRSIALTTRCHLWEGDLLAPSLVRVCRATGAREAIPLDTEEPLLAQALAFLGAVRGGVSHEIATGHDGMRALLVAERARRAAR